MKIRSAVLELLHADRQTDKQTDRHGETDGGIVTNFSCGGA
jgi:hypothetical protein